MLSRNKEWILESENKINDYFYIIKIVKFQ